MTPARPLARLPLRSPVTADPPHPSSAAHDDFYRLEDENADLKAQLERLQAELKAADEESTEVESNPSEGKRLM